MIKSFTFLSYLTCLLLMLVYPGSQEHSVVAVTGPATALRQQADSLRAAPPVVAQSNGHTFPVDDLIGIPEPPASQPDIPNSIKDFSAADPAEGISLIEAPTANSNGNGVLAFPLKLPEGRQGMQPALTVQYNNEAAGNWLGTGWNLLVPGVSIDTRWGVPRYDAGLETEIYLLNGDQLAPVNNRSALVARSAGKQFYPRVEGAFNRIIRKGNNPGNYWWEVTDKKGIRYSYGGRGNSVVNEAVLRDDQGNIAYWALVETRDLDDNYVQYDYVTVTDNGVAGGSVPGRQLYLSRIAYTGNGAVTGPYTVDFLRDRQLNEPKRNDIAIDARLGFKMVSADLLRKVTISFNNSLIRSYEFNYAEGAFYKTLLKSISELDDAGAVFYKHEFDYYDDVNKQQGYLPEKGRVTWRIGSDDIKGGLLSPIDKFEDGSSALSTAKAVSKGGSVAVTVGSLFLGDGWSKNTSLGGAFQYGEDDEEALVAMTDINGDGLPDKLFKKGGRLFYRANLGVATHSFGDVKPVNGVNDFGTGNGKSIGGGAQVIPYSAFLGYNYLRTTTTSKVYCADFNGDGLVDIASDGRVYFNHLNAQGDPEFVLNSGLTPSPIFTGSVDKAFLARDTALQSQQERDYPLQDIVRLWEAPYDGVINITAPVQLLPVPNPTGIVSAKKDGVRVSIQRGDVLLWDATIDANDLAPKAPVNVTGLTVAKGQRFYFRLQSRYNGEDDLVNWDPIIEYTTPVTPSSDVHHKIASYYRASADFILHSKSTAGIGKDGAIVVDGSFSKKITSDSVTLQITRVRGGVTTILFEKAYAGRELANGALPASAPLPVLTGDNVFFSLVSHSYIDRSALLWKPHYAYVSFADATPVLNNNNQPTLQGWPVPDNSNYNYRFYAEPPVTVAQQDTVILFPQVTGGTDGMLWLTIKGTDTIYARRKVYVNGGVMNTAIDSIRLIRKANEPLFVEYATDSMDFARTLQQPALEVYRDSFFLNAGLPDTIRLADTVRANLYVNPEQPYLGSLYRGWGQFVWKGDKGDATILESKLNLDELNSYPSDPANFTDSTSISNVKDPAKTDFVVLFPDGAKEQWAGFDTSLYVTGNLMSSSRLWLHDVSVDSLMAGESAGAVHKVSVTSIHSFAAGAGSAGPGGAGSFASTVSKLDMMYMNGDRFPDVLNDEMIQYTLPNGGLGAGLVRQPIGETLSEGWATGVGAGGLPQASTDNSTKSGAVAAPNTASTSMGISANVNINEDAMSSSWIDINGDGLMDRIYKDGIVQLNLGYRFASGEQWGISGIESGRCISASAGAGVSIFAGSFEAGIGLVRTEGNNNFMLNDVNGDGLPDQLEMGSVIQVRLNTGNGFGPTMAWKGFDALQYNVSVGESINAAFSISIPIPIPFFPIKICINPGGDVGHGVSRQEKAIVDIDGDGYADMARSDNDGHLESSISSIGRTNMLRGVRGPLGASFTMDYERVGNTYDMPQSKWVLKSVEQFDGLAGDGVDTMRRRFSYEGGYQDRYEREFYGFGKVISQELNTANNNSVYRSQVQLYLNNTYYNKGLLAAEWLEDGKGKKYYQTNNLYQADTVRDLVVFPALKRSERSFYEGAATAGVTTATQFGYDALGNITHIADAGDGSQQDMILADITYHDIDAYYVKAVPASVEVTTAEGVKRKRTTEVNDEGDIIRIRQYLADGTAAVTDMEYDDYGNLLKLTQPANYNGQRLWYSYEYDNVLRSYVTRETNAYKDTVTNTYDYKLGLLTGSVNRNREPVQYRYDNRGRMTAFTGPCELAAGKPYTVAYSYNTQAAVAYAQSRYYDPEYHADINLVSFVDGLGRSVQVKKQVAVFKGKGQADEVRMQVSGKMMRDAFGREEKTYYPLTEPLGNALLTLNTGLGTIESTVTHDVLDRPLKTVLADGATDSVAYTTANGLFSALTTDALGNRTEAISDVRGRKRYAKAYGGPAGTVTTRFDYNALGELVKAMDAKGNAFTATYDNLGRKVRVQHPDAGITDLVYDLSGNLLKKITPQIRKEIREGGAIQYQYYYGRITDIDYPRNYQNKVRYTYGKPGSGNKAGRIILQEDASGGQEFFYGKQGEVTKVIRTVVVSPVFATTYVSEQEYDTWHRVKKLAYPDGEIVSYHYNKGGGLYSMEGSKRGTLYKYVEQAGYDEYEQRTYLRFGNGSETQYTYENQRRRLTQLKVTTQTGQPLMNATYNYDAVSNILGVVNNGLAKQGFHYDNLYRLDSASGEFNGAKGTTGYGVRASYDNLNNLVRKTMRGASTDESYDNAYVYESGPHQASQIGNQKYRYDANGNQLGAGDRENFWDEENRLMAVLNKGVLNQYTYDADGNRVVKSSGGLQSIWVNGAPAGAVKHNENYTTYVNPYVSCSRTGFVKHYFIEDLRVATKLGHGSFTNITFPQSGLTAGNIDYIHRAAEMEKQRQEYYASLALSPGPPTDKNYYAKPENNGIAAPVFVDSTATNVPPGWPGNTARPPNGPPVFVSPAPSSDSVQAGYGFNDPGHLYESAQFFYHPDHWGSTAYVSNTLGEASLHMEYSPFGETVAEEHTGSYVTNYLFNGKGSETETGYYHYDKRYYVPAISQWLTIADPLGENYPYVNMGGYTPETGVEEDVSTIVLGVPGAAVSSYTEGLDVQDADKQDEAKKRKQQQKPPRNKGILPGYNIRGQNSRSIQARGRQPGKKEPKTDFNNIKTRPRSSAVSNKQQPRLQRTKK
jgi:RHS repeat-associated protein